MQAPKPAARPIGLFLVVSRYIGKNDHALTYLPVFEAPVERVAGWVKQREAMFGSFAQVVDSFERYGNEAAVVKRVTALRRLGINVVPGVVDLDPAAAQASGPEPIAAPLDIAKRLGVKTRGKGLRP